MMRVLLDMDGVLANYPAAFAAIFGADSTSPADYHAHKMHLVGTDFFSKIPPFANTVAIIEAVVARFGGYSICSAPMVEDVENSTAHKLIWLYEHMPIKPDNIIFTQDKWEYADAHTVLVDDRIRNINEFNRAGGVGLLFINDGSNLATKSLMQQLIIIEEKVNAKI